MAEFQRRDLLRATLILVVMIAGIFAVAGVEKKAEPNGWSGLTVTYTGLGLTESDQPILGRRWRRAVYVQPDAPVPLIQTYDLQSGRPFCPFEIRSMSGRLMAEGLGAIDYEMGLDSLPLPRINHVRSATFFDEEGTVVSKVDDQGIGTQSYIGDDGVLRAEVVTDKREQKLRWLRNGKWINATNDR